MNIFNFLDKRIDVKSIFGLQNVRKCFAPRWRLSLIILFKKAVGYVIVQRKWMALFPFASRLKFYTFHFALYCQTKIIWNGRSWQQLLHVFVIRCPTRSSRNHVTVRDFIQSELMGLPFTLKCFFKATLILLYIFLLPGCRSHASVWNNIYIEME